MHTSPAVFNIAIRACSCQARLITWKKSDINSMSLPCSCSYFHKRWLTLSTIFLVMTSMHAKVEFPFGCTDHPKTLLESPSYLAALNMTCVLPHKPTLHEITLTKIYGSRLQPSHSESYDRTVASDIACRWFNDDCFCMRSTPRRDHNMHKTLKPYKLIYIYIWPPTPCLGTTFLMCFNC